MSNQLIEIVVLDKEGNEEFRRDFETKKEARQWVKDAGKDREFWARRSESDHYPATLDKIELHINGECEQDWFLSF